MVDVLFSHLSIDTSLGEAETSINLFLDIGFDLSFNGVPLIHSVPEKFVRGVAGVRDISSISLETEEELNLEIRV